MIYSARAECRSDVERFAELAPVQNVVIRHYYLGDNPDDSHPVPDVVNGLLKSTEAAEREAEIRPKPGRNGPGRPTEPGSRRDVAAKTGITRSEQTRIEQHVTLAEQHPAFQRPRVALDTL